MTTSGRRRRGAGAVPGSTEAWLLLRGMRTLYPRVRQSSATALAIAQRFEEDPRLDGAARRDADDHVGDAIHLSCAFDTVRREKPSRGGHR